MLTIGFGVTQLAGNGTTNRSVGLLIAAPQPSVVQFTLRNCRSCAEGDLIPGHPIYESPFHHLDRPRELNVRLGASRAASGLSQNHPPVPLAALGRHREADGRLRRNDTAHLNGVNGREAAICGATSPTGRRIKVTLYAVPIPLEGSLGPAGCANTARSLRDFGSLSAILIATAGRTLAQNNRQIMIFDGECGEAASMTVCSSSTAALQLRCFSLQCSRINIPDVAAQGLVYVPHKLSVYGVSSAVIFGFADDGKIKGNFHFL